MSNNFIRGSLFFISGAAITYFITNKILDKKYKDIADEEIKSVKEMYERKLEKITTIKSSDEIFTVELTADANATPCEVTKATIVNPYGSLVSDLGYRNEKKENEEEMTDNAYIEVIPPDDFGECGYKCESLTYYADKVLTYNNDEKITNINDLIGINSLNTFGEYEDDSVFVRNHGMKTDFEILLDNRRYSDVVGDDSTTDTNDEQ